MDKKINLVKFNREILNIIINLVDVENYQRIKKEISSHEKKLMLDKLFELNNYLKDNNYKFLTSNHMDFIDLQTMMNIYYTQLYPKDIILDNYIYIIKFLDNIKTQFKPDMWYKQMFDIYLKISIHL